MNLSKRLLMNVSLVPEGAKVADIGCDHGYASIWLITERIARRVIAMDINEGPLCRARKHIKDAGLEGQIECRLSNGTEKIVPGEVDTLMIAGMGGPLMRDILTEGEEVLAQVTTLVLQPQSEIHVVRHFLAENGFTIQKEKICREDGKYYFALQAVRGQESGVETPREEWQFRYGTYLVKTGDEVFRQYLEKERDTYRTILKNPGLSNGNRERKEEIQHTIDEIEYCLALGEKAAGGQQNSRGRQERM